MDSECNFWDYSDFRAFKHYNKTIMMKPKPTAKDRMMMLKKKHVRDVEKDTNRYPDGTVEKSKSVFRKDGGQKVKVKTASPNGEVKKTKIVRK